jgi:hypothetical protein
LKSDNLRLTESIDLVLDLLSLLSATKAHEANDEGYHAATQGTTTRKKGGAHKGTLSHDLSKYGDEHGVQIHHFHGHVVAVGDVDFLADFTSVE